MPSTVLMARSICSVISVSTSSGAPPGSGVRTLTIGTSTDGKRSTPSEERAAVPTTTSARISIAAKIGRRMQISASFCILLPRHAHGLPLLQRSGRADHELSRREPAHDLHPVTGAGADRHRRFDHLAVLHAQHLL